MIKKMSKAKIVILLSFLLFIIIAIVLFFSDFFYLLDYKNLKEYDSFVTSDGLYTISIREDSPVGLIDGMRLNIYVVNNTKQTTKYIDRRRLDFYEDFTPYIDYTEKEKEIIVTFHSKFSNSEVSVPKY